MAIRQQVVATGLDAVGAHTAAVAAIAAADLRLQCRELTRGAEHVELLRDLLGLQTSLAAAGMDVATVSQAALSLSCSEARAGRLLGEANALVALPGALEAVQCGLLTVEQSSTVVEQLAVLELPGRLAVWRRLQQRLVAQADGTVLPPPRLAELLRRWVVEHDRAAAEERRRRAQEGRRVDYRRRDDGLVDVFGLGFTGPDAQAVLSRIAERARRWGADDDRTADQRRFDAFRDLLLGRDQQPLLADDAVVDGAECPCTRGAGSGCGTPLRSAGAAPCGCLPGSPAPCGAAISVLLPIGAGLGTTDEVAELVGHGPLEPDLLRALLAGAPSLRPVWVDDDGVPVAVGDRAVRLSRGGPDQVRQALLDLQALSPPPPQPRHPLDHRPVRPAPGAAAPPPPSPTIPTTPPTTPTPAAPPRSSAPVGVTPDEPGLPGAHPPGTPGPYRPPRWLRRLVNARAPRCEWPGCGARAVRCDAEHDRAHPDGPTCACNLGPCCRRHHRVKQSGWTKTRGGRSLVSWTSPTRRTWRGTSPHEPPATPVRPPALPTADPYDELTPYELEDELALRGLLPDDHGPWTVLEDLPAPDEDRTGRRLLHGDTAWDLDLRDPWLWLAPQE